MWFKKLFSLKKKNIISPTEINMGFWDKIPKPFFVMAPLADVTDCAFRQIIAKHSRHGEVGGGPDVFWTEFVSADGLASPKGREALMIDLKYSENERPIVAQLFGSSEKNMESAARLCAELGFDGIDINMGCPDRSIIKQCAGAAHIKDPGHAVKIIASAKRGAPNLPVSVKTRLGFHRNEFETWIPKLLSADISVLTIHGRTMKDMSLVPARWDDITRVVDIVRSSGKKTLVIGNGDAKDIPDAMNKIETSGVDGVMFGRAIFGNPWLFDKDKNHVSVKEKLLVMLEHTKLFVDMLGDKKNFSLMKKHYKAYVNGFDGAKELRVRLMEAEDYASIEAITREFLGQLG